MCEGQLDFRSGLGTREALFIIQVLIERCIYVICDVHLYFSDYTKEFDNSQHNNMIDTLMEIGKDGKAGLLQMSTGVFTYVVQSLLRIHIPKSFLCWYQSKGRNCQ